MCDSNELQSAVQVYVESEDGVAYVVPTAADTLECLEMIPQEVRCINH